MAIREYGESLLQDVRDRKQAEAQRIRKRQKRGELLGLAGMGLSYLGASKMKSQWDTFTKNEDVMNTNIMINSATKNNKDISDFTNTIKGSGKSQQDYFLDRTVDETLNSLLLKEENIKYNKNKESREAFKSAFAPQIRELQEIKDAANKSLDIYNSSVVAQEKFKTSGTKKDAEKLSKERLGNRITSLFNQGDRQQEAVESYRNSLHAKSAGDLAMFDQLLKETGGDYVTAYKLADDFQLNAKNLEQLSKREFNHSITDEGKMVGVYTITDFEGNVTTEKPFQMDLRDIEAQVQSQLSQFDAGSELKANITSSGIDEMMTKGFKIVPKTQDELDNNNKLYNEYFASHPVATLSQAQILNQKNLTLELTALKSSAEYKQSKGTVFNANRQIARLKLKIENSNPQGTTESVENYQLRLNKLYDSNSEIRQYTQEVSINLQEQARQEIEIQNKYKLDDPDDAETASGVNSGKSAVGTGTGLSSIKVISTSGDDIEVDPIEDSEEEETLKTLSIEEVTNKYKIDPKTVAEIIDSASKTKRITQQGAGIDPVDIVTDKMLFESGYLKKPTRSNPYSVSSAQKYFARRKFVKDLFKDIRG